MNTENTRDEGLIDLGAFDIETKGTHEGQYSDSPILPTVYNGPGLTDA